MIRINRRALVPLWLLGDFLLIAFSYSLAVRFRTVWSFGIFQSHIPLDILNSLSHRLGTILIAYVVVAYLGGLLDSEILRLRHRSKIITNVVASCTFHIILLSSFYFFVLDAAFPRSILLMLTLLESVSLFFWRGFLFHWLFEIRKTTVVIIGPQDEFLEFNECLQKESGEFDLEQSFSSYAESIKYFRHDSVSTQPKSIVLSSQMLDHVHLNDFFLLLNSIQVKNIAEIYVLPNALHALMAGPNLKSLYDFPLIPLVESAHPIEPIVHRTIDILISAALLFLFLPIFILAAFAIKLSSSGPIIFSQKRVGLLGQPFSIYKFRTMIADAEKCTGPCLSWPGDDRIFPLGRLLRRLRIDEFPQLYNVLRGDMTLFGPRPERPEFVSELMERIPGYNSRHFIRPGITGLAQVIGNYRTDATRKLMFDLRHLSSNSIMFRADLLVKTVKTVLTAKGS